MLKSNKIYLGDCLELMQKIPNESIDMILCDLPYGTTACKWDSIIPLDLLWKEYKRIIKPNNAIVLTAAQPFTSMLISSNIKMYKHNWIWDKKRGSGFQIAKIRPMQRHEDILVFGKNKVHYFPLMIKIPTTTTGSAVSKSGSNPLASLDRKKRKYNASYPSSILIFSKLEEERFHPTQKPVKLFEYLIKTYTKEGELVLDNCIGSGTTAIACLHTNRKFIGIEKDKKYFKLANKRIQKILKLKEKGIQLKTLIE